jgi:hypothetical protein
MTGEAVLPGNGMPTLGWPCVLVAPGCLRYVPMRLEDGKALATSAGDAAWSC